MDKLVHEQTPAEYFKELIDKALERQGSELSELSSFYLVNLLETFVRQGESYAELGVGEDPRLAELLCLALMAHGRRRLSLLKATGDVSLFVSGFFSDSLAGGLVDSDYYVRMGGYAYGRLAGLSRHRTAASVFGELSENFLQFVDILNEVSEVSSLTDNKSLLRLYEKWLLTGSRRIENLLRKSGVLLVRGSDRVH
jgi:hypothetical protein